MNRSIALFIPALALTLLAGAAAQAQTPATTPAPPGMGANRPHHAPWGGGGGLFENADTNHDGYVSREEFLAARAAAFTKMDRNHDGFFDAQDLPERAKQRPNAAERINAMIQQFDTDHDGKLSQQEFAQGQTPFFDKADTDGNGSLDKQEIQAAREQARARFKSLRQQGGAPGVSPMPPR